MKKTVLLRINNVRIRAGRNSQIDFLTAVDEKNIIVVKELTAQDQAESLKRLQKR